MPNMKVPIRFGRKAGVDPALVFIIPDIFLYYSPDKIKRGGFPIILKFFFFHFFVNELYQISNFSVKLYV